jgi:hypothetical protein
MTAPNTRQYPIGGPDYTSQPKPLETLHIICERDVGLFSLIQQVISNIPWALSEGRIPIAYFQGRTCYWTPKGYRGADNVWEYYFEAIFPEYPAAYIPARVQAALAIDPPSAFEPGRFVEDNVFASAHFGDHESLIGKSIAIPYLLEDPGETLRVTASQLIREFVRPRRYIRDKVEYFYRKELRGRSSIGVHIRGTDAVSIEEKRQHRQNSLHYGSYREEIHSLLKILPRALVFVATDAEESLVIMREEFGDRVVAYDSLRHTEGPAAGMGPTGWIMPGYIADDRDRAARNGEEAVVEYLLLTKCSYLVHNGSSLARTVLLHDRAIPHVNTHTGFRTFGEL